MFWILRITAVVHIFTFTVSAVRRFSWCVMFILLYSVSCFKPSWLSCRYVKYIRFNKILYTRSSTMQCLTKIVRLVWLQLLADGQMAFEMHLRRIMVSSFTSTIHIVHREPRTCSVREAITECQHIFMHDRYTSSHFQTQRMFIILSDLATGWTAGVRFSAKARDILYISGIQPFFVRVLLDIISLQLCTPKVVGV
jgi:hypothetical protein